MHQLEILDQQYEVIQIVEGVQRQYTLNVTTDSLKLIDITSNEIRIQWTYDEFQIDWATTPSVMVISTLFNDYKFQVLDCQLPKLKETLNGRSVYLNVYNYYSPGNQIGNGAKLSTLLSTGENHILNFIALRTYKQYQEIINVMVSLRKILNSNKYFQYAQELFYEQNQLIDVQIYHPNSGDLAQFIKKHNYQIPLDKSIEIMKLILHRLTLLHSEGIIHRKIQLSSIYFKDLSDYTTLRITDFTLGTTNPESHGLVGTPGYIAPEVFQGLLNQKSDIYSTAVLFHLLLTQENMYPQDNSIMSLNILNQYQISPKIGNIPLALDLLQVMLTSVDNRISAEECLNHSFFTQMI